MATLIVSYPASEGATFDRDYYTSTHTQIAGAVWGSSGLQSAEVLFPVGAQPFLAMTILRFIDQAAIDAALGSAETAKVIGDIVNFTNVSPIIFRAED